MEKSVFGARKGSNTILFYPFLGFDAKEMYLFIAERFNGTNVEVQRQALQWLQLLCLLNIHIPLEILFDMFSDGMKVLHKGPIIKEATSENTENIEATEDKKPKMIIEVRSGGSCLDPDNICLAARPRSPFSGNFILILTHFILF